MNYNEMYKKFLKGVITTEEWQEYCTARLHEIMQENVDVFIRLKDR
jgi:hypothetical protein